MLKSDTLHLLFKFHEEAIGEFQGKHTMEEHLRVQAEKDCFIWGHFTSNKALNGLWNQKITKLENQLKNGAKAFVFFCDSVQQLLYVGEYVESFKRAELESTSPEIEFIPKYYHHKVGKPLVENPNELRSYAYVKVKNTKKIDFAFIDNIFTDKATKNERVLENKGMSSKFYVQLNQELYDLLENELNCVNNISSSTEIISNTAMESSSTYDYDMTTEVLDNNNGFQENITLSDTEKEAIIKQRVGQGVFKRKLLKNNYGCIICGLKDERFLIASHIKPWHDSNAIERLDENNGFLLCSHHDALFDKNLITFSDSGKIIISNTLDERTRALLNINEDIKIALNSKQREYLQWHREKSNK